MLPQSIVQNVQESLNFDEYTALGGSSLNNVGKLTSDSGSYFIKWNTIDQQPVFEAEIAGLHILRKHCGDLIIPEMMLKNSNHAYTWVIFDFIEEKKWQDRSAEQFGRHLAKLHRNTYTYFGFESDNYIGKLPQKNKQTKKWDEFFIQYRFLNLLKKAIDKGLISAGFIKNGERLASQLSSIFPNESPSLIHGDLWSGNYMQYGDQTVLIDPAVYFANREIELAFTRLFGGFPTSFYAGYESEWPFEPGFESRIEIYNLYPLLVHTLLFGASYASQVMHILRRY